MGVAGYLSENLLVSVSVGTDSAEAECFSAWCLGLSVQYLIFQICFGTHSARGTATDSLGLCGRLSTFLQHAVLAPRLSELPTAHQRRVALLPSSDRAKQGECRSLGEPPDLARRFAAPAACGRLS